MGYREMTNPMGGCEGETPGNPFSYGQGPMQPYGYAPQFAPLVDRMIGRAFHIVKYVADHLGVIKYVAFNMEAIVICAQQFQANNPLILASAEAATNAAAVAAASLATAETASFATASTKAPRRIALGLESFPVTSAVGQVSATNCPVYMQFVSPVIVNPGEFVAIAAKNIGTVTTAGAILSLVTYDAYWE